MKKQKQPKLQLSIPEPCHEKWEEMTPLQGGRFCHQCDRHIVNFTDMSDHELAFYYQKYEGKICGVFRPDQLDRPIALPVAPKLSGKWKVAAAVAAGLLVSGGVSGQKSVELDAIPIEQEWRKGKVVKKYDSSTNKIVKGTIIDEEGETLIGANIFLRGTSISTVSDLEGKFMLEIPEKHLAPVLHISYTGYETLIFADFDSNKEHKIKMKPALDLRGEVVVIAGYAIDKNDVSRTYFKQEKETKVKITKISPNPFTEQFSIQLKTNKEGSHLINLYDLNGQLLYAQTFHLTKGKQTLSLDNLPSNLAAGSYILQVTRGNEILLTEKVVKAE